MTIRVVFSKEIRWRNVKQMLKSLVARAGFHIFRADGALPQSLPEGTFRPIGAIPGMIEFDQARRYFWLAFGQNVKGAVIEIGCLGCCGVFGQWYRLIFYAARTCCW